MSGAQQGQLTLRPSGALEARCKRGRKIPARQHHIMGRVNSKVASKGTMVVQSRAM